jgi:ABC-type antimicrobial peptide transport system permease subunit
MLGQREPVIVLSEPSVILIGPACIRLNQDIFQLKLLRPTRINANFDEAMRKSYEPASLLVGPSQKYMNQPSIHPIQPSQPHTHSILIRPTQKVINSISSSSKKKNSPLGFTSSLLILFNYSQLFFLHLAPCVTDSSTIGAKHTKEDERRNSFAYNFNIIKNASKATRENGKEPHEIYDIFIHTFFFVIMILFTLLRVAAL